MNNAIHIPILLFQDDSMREDYFLGAALAAMIIIALIFLFVWSRKQR
ncbi:hypothetical protein POV27_06970 [Aureisphaera galaxeae]|nr:hypothetical protein [Aureisphaera galaxeae]MDC8003786.1 hypothetical protein [Aureisphaera galaxeae]